MSLPPLPPIARPDPPKIDFTAPTYPINPDKTIDFKVMLARFPGNNQEHPDSSGYLLKILPSLIRDERISELVPFRKSGTPIPAIRNLCVRTAIRENCDYILMIDNDMSPDCEPDGSPFWDMAWRFMMARRVRESGNYRDPKGQPLTFDSWWESFAPCAVAAPYCGEPPAEPVCMLSVVGLNGADNPDRIFRIKTIDRHDAFRRSGIGRVDAAGTGLILFDTRMFYYLPPPWFSYDYEDAYESKVVSTEDVVETRNASLLGMPVYCAWDCWSGHHKLKKVVKPRPLAMELVRGSLRDAFEKQISTLTRLHFRHPDAT